MALMLLHLYRTPIRISTEYKVTFNDGTVTLVWVHADQTLDSAIETMLQAAGDVAEEINEVMFLRAFDLESEMSGLDTE